MTTLQERRHASIIAQLAKQSDRRESLITSLIKCEWRLKKLRQQAARSQKRMAAQEWEAQAKPKATDVTAEVAKIVSEPKPIPPAMAAEASALNAKLNDAIPDFLRRGTGSIGGMTPADVKAREEIETQQADRKRTKSRVRIEKMKAKASGDTKKMPLTGKDALAAIRR